MDDSFPHLATSCATNGRNPEQHQRVTVLDVVQSLHEPQQGMGTWRTTNANREDRQKPINEMVATSRTGL